MGCMGRLALTKNKAMSSIKLNIKPNTMNLIHEILSSFYIAKLEKGILLLSGLVGYLFIDPETFANIVIPGLSAVLTIGVSVYYGIKKHKQNLEQKHENHVLEVMAKLIEIGTIEKGTPLEEMRIVAEQFIETQKLKS